MDYKKIGSFIADLRKEKNLTQKDLADSLYITDRAVSKWERGKGCPDISLLDDLSKILDISIIEILKGERMNKKEQIKNNELIYSMNYADANVKEKINTIFNAIAITIIVIISSIILINNIKINIYLNELYYPNVIYSNDTNLFNDINNKIEIIKNNQGKYTDLEYKEILQYINYFRNIDSDSKLYSQKYYTFNDIKEFSKTDYRIDIYKLQLSPINNMYRILENYNGSINIDSNLYDNITELHKFVNNFYKYDYSSYDKYSDEYANPGNYLKQLLNEKYTTYDKILTYIINGGDLNV